MKPNILDQYLSLRKALHRERAQLEARLEQINRALSDTSAAPTASTKPLTRAVRRIKNSISMKAAVIEATTGHPMTKQEILEAIQKMGFRSASKNPMASLSTLLYGKNPRFKNVNGRFSALSPARGAARTEPAAKAVKPSRKRKMSAAGRARLSALAKARWAKIKKAGGKRL